MLLVDTSVLIDFLKGEKNEPCRKFQKALESAVPFGITSQIFQEVLQGAKSIHEFNKLHRYLASQIFFHPKYAVESYTQAAKIYFKCRKKGFTIRSTIDCLIAQITIEHNLALLHNDNDFKAIATVIPLKQF